MSRSRSLDSILLRRLERSVSRGDRTAEAQFWKEASAAGTPLVEPIPLHRSQVRVTYVWRGDRRTHAVGLHGPQTEHGTLEWLKRLPGTHVWYRTVRAPSDLFGTYFFVPNAVVQRPGDGTEWMRLYRGSVPDPLNPNRFGKPRDPEVPRHPLNGIPLSAFSLPRAPHHPETARRPGVPQGTVTLHRVTSQFLGGRRRVWSYVPAGGVPARADAGLAVFMDGFWYVHEIAAPTTLDNLIAQGEIPPTVALFVDALDLGTRLRELSCSPSFGNFLVEELLPWSRRHFRRSFRATRTLLAGASLGGLSALHWALLYPSHFRGVISQSGSFWWRRRESDEPVAMAREVMDRPQRPLRVYMDAGRYEASSPVEDSAGHLGANRHVRDLLRMKGHSVYFQMYSGGHDDYCWRETLVDALRWVASGKQSHRV